MKVLLKLSALLVLAVTGLALPIHSQETKSAEDAWADWRPLLGKWTGEGGGGSGQASGWFSFSEELQGRILLRRNRADYPATSGKPAYTHDDLMAIYHDSDDGTTRAEYFDNEGHVIHYRVRLEDGGKTIVFESDPQQHKPQFRLTYILTGPNRLSGRFEIAPPGKAGAFEKYLEWTARRKGPAAH